MYRSATCQLPLALPPRSRSNGVSMSAGLVQRKHLVAATITIALVLLLWPHLAILAQVGYCYAWWLRPEVHWASPDNLPPGNSSAVPRVIHQTWQTTEVPQKWAAARQSCIDLHPDYEHRLWTDADGLKFIEVS